MLSFPYPPRFRMNCSSAETMRRVKVKRKDMFDRHRLLVHPIAKEAKVIVGSVAVAAMA